MYNTCTYGSYVGLGWRWESTHPTEQLISVFSPFFSSISLPTRNISFLSLSLSPKKIKFKKTIKKLGLGDFSSFAELPPFSYYSLRGIFFLLVINSHRRNFFIAGRDESLPHPYPRNGMRDLHVMNERFIISLPPRGEVS